MPATTDSKGITSGYIAGEDGWGDAMNTNMRVVSAALMNGFSNNASTTTGLTYGYRGGVGLTAGGVVAVSAGTILLPASSTVYVVRDVAGVVSLDADGVFPDKIAMALVVTNATNIISISDGRYSQDHVQDGRLFARFFTTLTNPAQAGAVRLGNNEAVIARNAANTIDLNLLSLDAAGRTRISESAQATIVGGNLDVGGAVTTVGGNLTGLRLIADNDAAANGVETTMLSLKAGTDGVLDSVYYQITTVPSATGPNRIVIAQIGDSAALRDYALKASQVYIGSGIPAFVSTEMLNVDGELRADSVVASGDVSSSGQFIGSGAGLSAGSIPQAAVSNFATHTHDISTQTTGQLPNARIDYGADLAYTGTNTGARSFNTIIPDLPAAGVSYNQAAQQDLIEQVNTIGDCLRQLAFDLNRINF